MEHANVGVYSPSWKKPSDVMREFKKRKRALQARMDKQKIYSKSNSVSNNASNSNEESQLTQRCCRNPFRKLQSNDDNLDTSSNLSSDVTLFRLLTQSQEVPSLNITDKIVAALKSDEPSPKPDAVSKEPQWETRLPLDWSLKTHLRLMSSSPLTWKTQSKTKTEGAAGLTGQCCFVWQHPSLPWLKLFPRQKRMSSVKSLFASKTEIVDAFYNKWHKSFYALFQLLRYRQCPFFYICAPDFVVLFRAAGLAGISETNAMISPTTKGLRKILKDEGIEFTVPLKKSASDTTRSSDESSNSSSSHSSSNNAGSFEDWELQDDLELDGNMDDEDVDSWLANSGLDSSVFLSASQKRFQREEIAKDRHPESLAYIEGVDVQALFNFLLNERRLCVSTSGPMSGVPATLLSPVQFEGATWEPLPVKQITRQLKDGAEHCLEIQGPIMPHVVHTIAKLNASCGCPKYRMSSHTLPSTSTFSTNINTPFVPPAFATQSLLDCGLDSSILETFCSVKTCSTVDEIKSENGKFSYR